MRAADRGRRPWTAKVYLAVGVVSVLGAGLAIATGGVRPVSGRTGEPPKVAGSPAAVASSSPPAVPSAGSSPAPSGPSSTSATGGVARQRAERRLDRLPVIARRPPTGYARTQDFGSSWVDTDDNGCNQRDDVLVRDAHPGTVRVRRQGSCDHDVVAGTWVDPYTKRRHVMTDMKDLAQAQTVQIDHVVPLAEAWASGADRWSRSRRISFANDLPELLAVDGPTNASKGDGDPAAWRPRKAYQCAYAERWIAVKTTWRLGADRSEIAALRQMLGYCRS